MKTSPASALATSEAMIHAAGAQLNGDLALPEAARGVVLFAHGSGSGRRSPRNRAVARTLNEAGFATLLLDLLTQAEEVREERGARLRFDVRVLAERLVDAIDWLAREPATRQLPIGLFGASTGAAAALVAATLRAGRVRAVVSRGGRPDLAEDALDAVRTPTLLIVGGADEAVLALNRASRARLACVKDLRIVPGATHLFEERGALEQVSRAAAEWFALHLGSNGRSGLQRAIGDAEC